VLTFCITPLFSPQAEFDMVALDKHFELVNEAATKVLAPLQARSEKLAVTHGENLKKLQKLAAQRTSRSLGAADLASSDLKKSASEAWRDASEPLRIELTTIGTTIALLIGMFVANFAHGRKGIRSSRQVSHERSRLVSAPAGLSKYGAFE
jgi:hypothetical protein